MTTEAKLFAEISVTVEEMSIKGAGMHVLIRHAQQSKITVSATQPTDWRITDGRIVRINGSKPGTAGATICGGTVVVSGSNVVAVSASQGSVVTVSGRNNISVQAGYGSAVHIDAPSTRLPAALELTDQIEIVVPIAFSVPLDLFLRDAKVEIDSWVRGHLNLYGSGTVSATLAGLPLK